MKDQTMNNNQPTDDSQASGVNQSADDFYDEIENMNVSKDQLQVMAAITQAQADSAEKAGNLVTDMENLVKEENSTD